MNADETVLVTQQKTKGVAVKGRLPAMDSSLHIMRYTRLNL